MLDPRICQSTKNNTKKHKKGKKQKNAIISPKGQMGKICLYSGRACASDTLQAGITGPEPVDIRTFDKAGPVKTVPCKLYGVPTG